MTTTSEPNYNPAATSNRRCRLKSAGGHLARAAKEELIKQAFEWCIGQSFRLLVIAAAGFAEAASWF